MTCTAKVGTLVADLPVKLDGSGRWSAEPPKLPELRATPSEALVADVQKRTEENLTCLPNLYYWKGHTAAPCQMTVEGGCVDVEVTIDDANQLGVALATKDSMLAAEEEQVLTTYFHDRLKIDGEVDCGRPRVRKRELGRKMECTATWTGGRALLLVVSKDGRNGYLVLESEGLARATIEAIVAAQ